MGILVYFAVALVAAVAAVALAPKPESQPAAGLDEVNAPTAEAGKEIPILFGTRKISGPNVVWYGDLMAEPVFKKGGKK